MGCGRTYHAPFGQNKGLMDQLLRADGLTTQQAALITVVDLLGTRSLSQAAAALWTTHQPAAGRDRRPKSAPGMTPTRPWPPSLPG